MGKTELVREFVHCCSEDFSAVSWINANSAETIKSSFLNLAQRIATQHSLWPFSGALSSFKDKEATSSRSKEIDGSPDLVFFQDIPYILKQWLSQTGNDEWLIVLDDLDMSASEDLLTFLPQPLNGQIVVTSRLAQEAVFGPCNQLKIDPMTLRESITLYKSLQKSRAERDRGKFAKPRF